MSALSSSTLALPAHQERRVASIAEDGFAWLTLFMGTGALIPLVHSSAAWTGVFAFCAFSLAARALPHSLIKSSVLLLAGFLAVLSASTAWSAFPADTVKQSAALIGTTIAGMYLAKRFDPLQLLCWASTALLVAGIISLVVVLLAPGIGIDGGIGWRGIFEQKNWLGRTMVLCFGAWLTRFMFGLGDRRISALCIVFSTFMVFESHARIAWLSLSLTPLVFFALRKLLRKDSGLPALLLFLFGLSIPALANAFLAAKSAASTNHALLTGRYQLWTSVWHAIEQQPWLGYGYGGFWHGLDGPSRTVIFAVNGGRGWGWSPPHAHNGVLQMWLSGGIIAVAIFLFVYVAALVRTLHWAKSSPSAESYFAVFFLYFIFIHNLTEVVAPTYKTIYWILFVAIAVRRVDDRPWSNAPLRAIGLRREEQRPVQEVRPPIAAPGATAGARRRLGGSRRASPSLRCPGSKPVCEEIAIQGYGGQG